jgi:hypothetical protein
MGSANISAGAAGETAPSDDMAMPTTESSSTIALSADRLSDAQAVDTMHRLLGRSHDSRKKRLRALLEAEPDEVKQAFWSELVRDMLHRECGARASSFVSQQGVAQG